ncbi:MAG: SCP-like extracellular protein [Chloroflexi bacterium OLB14]|nr:MAG: SCP-like extracellular protein [Chloroflexi bacterium OLB14]
MKKKILLFMLLLLGVGSVPLQYANAKPVYYPITSPAELIQAVNELRASYGLAALASHPILMQTAQAQADYMAATGNVTHTRPNGMTYTQQLLSLGFPLAGDLSLGGFRAENILSTYGYLDWNGVPPAWQDADHMNTMLSQNYTHIGVGISQANGSYYYAVDAAASTSNGQMQDTAQDVLSGSSGTSAEAAGVSQFMVPITLSTPDANGDVRHKVKYGQTLWSIAIAYGTTIKNIQALNGLGEDLTIYQGQDLLVLKNIPTPIPTAISTTTVQPIQPTQLFIATVTNTPTPSTAQIVATSTVETLETKTTNSANSRLLVILLIVAAFVGAGMAVWLIRDPNN